MTSPSPSEFLTFMRHITIRSSHRPSTIAPIRRCQHAVLPRRAISTSIPRYYAYGDPNKPAANPKTAQDRQHVKERTDRLDTQSDNAFSGMEDRAKGMGGAATEQRDPRNSTAKAKKDHPEAPDVVIGMQDERGSTGH